MIVTAVVIILAVLIFANLALSIYNTVSPPCNNVEDYFRSARVLPDGRTASLGSIPSGTDIHYVGAKTVETSNPNVVGLKSRDEDYTEDAIDSRELNDSVFYDAVNKIFGNKKHGKDTTSEARMKQSSYKGSNIAMFDADEGMTANFDHVNSNRQHQKPSGMMQHIQIDGYSDRNPNDW
jgi:hypothetical protein